MDGLCAVADRLVPAGRALKLLQVDAWPLDELLGLQGPQTQFALHSETVGYQDTSTRHDTGANVRITLGSGELNVAIQEDEAAISRHTGRPLRRGHLHISVQGRQTHETLTSALATGKKEGLRATEEGIATPTMWNITNSSFSYTDRGEATIYRHDVAVEQREEPFSIDRLLVADSVLQPYAYIEGFDDRDRLTIRASVRLDGEALARLREHMDSGAYHNVIREGINPESRKMRFGALREWSQDGDFTKQRLVLVDQAFDNDTNPIARLFEPERSNQSQSLAYVREAFEGLLDLMGGRGIITQEERAALEQVAVERIGKRLWRYSESQDIDKFPL